ncbi:MAG: alpha/beta fold hydrolase, partial [Anaerolineae bacterium]|nr:alpha/beta fold hydrolase [Anaerolineae bacterium]
FCMAARDGGVMVYRELAILLGKDHPVYGLRARGMGGEDLPFNRLEDMAAHYIAEMRTVQPHGPYYLAGYSSGGLTAYEIAQQLLQAGEEIAGLILLDTYGIGYPQKLPMSGLWHNNIYHSFEKIAVHRENLAKMILPEKITYLKSRLADRVQFRRKVWEERRRALFDPVFRRARQVRNANYQARFGYQPAPYPGDILFIRAERQPRGIQTDPKLGWGELFTGNLEIFEASGHHYAIMFEPGVRAVANKIKEYLATHQ